MQREATEALLEKIVTSQSAVHPTERRRVTFVFGAASESESDMTEMVTKRLFHPLYRMEKMNRIEWIGSFELHPQGSLA
jgi:hypothetical protein